jgi:hypothetical protein
VYEGYGRRTARLGEAVAAKVTFKRWLALSSECTRLAEMGSGAPPRLKD